LMWFFFFSRNLLRLCSPVSTCTSIPSTLGTDHSLQLHFWLFILLEELKMKPQ
jgi:hypothetical protein